MLDDRLGPLEDRLLRLEQGGSAHVLITDGDGQTPWVPLDVSRGVAITIVEGPVAGGIALGLVTALTATLSAPDGADRWDTSISLTVPVARPVRVEGEPGRVNTITPPPGDWPHWRIAVQQDSPVRFPCHVASLLDTTAIEDFLAYRGFTPPADRVYVRGVDLVIPSVDLGRGQIVIGIDLLGDLADGAVVDVLNFRSRDVENPPGPALEAAPAIVLGGVAYVPLAGGVHAGHLTLLARDDDGPEPEVLVRSDDPPVVTLPARSGGGKDSGETGAGGDSSRAQERGRRRAPTAPSPLVALPPSPPARPPGAVLDCEPPVPDPGPWSCEPTPPQSDCPLQAGATQCKVVRMRSERFCFAPGGSIGHATGRLRSWRVTFQLELGPSDGPLRTTSGFTYGREEEEVTTLGWTSGEGAHGLGQCMRWFRFTLVCAKAFVGSTDDVRLIGPWPEPMVWVRPCGKRKVWNRACLDELTSQTVCDRGP